MLINKRDCNLIGGMQIGSMNSFDVFLNESGTTVCDKTRGFVREYPTETEAYEEIRENE